VRLPSYPPTPLPNKGIRCHHFGQHYDIYIIYNIFYTLHQSTLTRKLVHYNGKRVVHQSVVHNFYLRTTAGNAWSPPLPHIPFLLFPNLSIWNTKFQKQPNEPNTILLLRTLQSGTKQLNHAYLVWKLAVKPTSCKFYPFSTPHSLLLPKVQQKPFTAALPSNITFLSLSQHFLYSPSNSFLQFQLVCCCYADDRWCGLPYVRLVNVSSCSLQY